MVTEQKVILVYNGEGHHIPGVPATDLTDVQVSAIARSVYYRDEDHVIMSLVASGLYEPVLEEIETPPPSIEIEEADDNEDDD